MNTTRTEQIISNARSLGTDALHTATALDLVAPVSGRTWTAMCCGCVAERDPHEEWPVYRLAMSSSDSSPGGCMTCAYTGCDTLVVSAPVAVEIELAVAA